MADPLAPFRWLDDHDEIFCVSFFRGLAPADVLRRFGPDGTVGREMSLDELSEAVAEFVAATSGGEGGGHVGVIQADGWSIAIEPSGWCAVLAEYRTRLSRGCEMVAVSRHDYAEDAFVHAADGEALTCFTPHSPTARWGSDPDGLNPAMHKLDLPTDPMDDDEWEATWERLYEDKIPRAFALAAEITGVPFTRNLLDVPFLVGPSHGGHADGFRPHHR
ncbi:DUF6461 domain-containing protein [Actinomadura sp. WMMB 499]|uniref:DUF6461 domain-containing protein n=1 Tax=Actinomadura sp. WMMB 499 TaxID=1219491 RepID=UPI0012479649|nr:DUF6461 domain-containing protein [Actinomadura sp. WMMB 499]QFG23376.1 hypothetical protein F7P10_21930 [Actinomadura sp. WMMB 499]